MRKWRIRDVMTTDVVTVREQTPYREIVDTLAAHRIGAAPVVDASGRVLGVVSESDLLYKVEFGSEADDRRILEGHRRRTARAKAAAAVARDLMSASAVGCTPETPIPVAARQMEQTRMTHLPVQDESGLLLGIVARGDLLRVYQRPDADVQRDVTDEIARAVLAFEPGTVSAEVHNGVTALTGRVDRLSVARFAARIAREVPGVVEVVDSIEYTYDDIDVPVWPVA